MKKLIILLLISLLGCGASPLTRSETRNLESEVNTGDVVFQYTNTRTAKLVEHVTGSRVTHVGIVIKRKGRTYVLEASGPVKYTPFRKFLAKSKKNWFTIKKPKKKLTKKQQNMLRRNAKKWVGKPYDIKFLWDNNKIYCSELVYKMYSEIGIDLGGKQKIEEVLGPRGTHGRVIKYYIKKYHKSYKKIPLKQTIVTPIRMFHSEKLEDYYDNYSRHHGPSP